LYQVLKQQVQYLREALSAVADCRREAARCFVSLSS